MWMFLYKMFGWDYVYVENLATSKIVRVKVAPNGERVFQPYSFQVNVIDAPLPIEGKVIRGWKTIPLTPNVTAV